MSEKNSQKPGELALKTQHRVLLVICPVVETILKEHSFLIFPW